MTTYITCCSFHITLAYARQRSGLVSDHCAMSSHNTTASPRLVAAVIDRAMSGIRYRCSHQHRMEIALANSSAHRIIPHVDLFAFLLGSLAMSLNRYLFGLHNTWDLCLEACHFAHVMDSDQRDALFLSATIPAIRVSHGVFVSGSTSYLLYYEVSST